jgi:hypothetical protein
MTFIHFYFERPGSATDLSRQQGDGPWRRLEGRIAVGTAHIGLATVRRFATGAPVFVTGRRRPQGDMS